MTTYKAYGIRIESELALPGHHSAEPVAREGNSMKKYIGPKLTVFGSVDTLTNGIRPGGGELIIFNPILGS